MKKVSKSPQRNTFQKEGYLERCLEEGKEPSQAYLEMWDKASEEDEQWAQEEHQNNLEYDLRTTDWILEKARTSESYAQNIYAALCNVDWQKLDTLPILKEERWSCSWRYAGGIVADMRQEGDYIDWYCSGIRGGHDMGGGPEEPDNGYVPEGIVTEEIRADFQKLGWVPILEKDTS